MAKTPVVGATCLINENLVIKGGADFFAQWRYDQTAPNGGRDPVDMSEWAGFIAFGFGSDNVWELDSCLDLTDDGWVLLHIPAETTRLMSERKKGDITYDYEVVLKTDQGFIMPFVEGEALVTDMMVRIITEEGE